MDMHLPALVFIDERSGAIGAPHVLTGSAAHHGPHELLPHGDALWVLWAGDATRYEPRSRVQNDLGITPIALASDGPAVFGLFATGEVARLDPPEAVRPVGRVPLPATHMAAGSGAVFGLSWTDARREVTTLTALEAERGALRFSLALDGAPYGLVAEGDALWAHLWRRRGDEMSSHVVEIDPGAGRVRSECEIEPAGRLDPVLGGHQIRPRLGGPGDGASALERVDLRTGSTSELAALDGPMDWAYLGPTAIWGCLQPAQGRGSTIVAVPLDGAPPRYHDVSGVDVSSYVPPPPPRIEAAQVEREVRDRLAGALLGGWRDIDADTGEPGRSRPYIRGVTIDGVDCRGAFPDTEMVVRFRCEAWPGVRFARGRRIWEDDGELSGVIRVMDVNLMEDVGVSGRGLMRPREPDAAGTVWI